LDQPVLQWRLRIEISASAGGHGPARTELEVSLTAGQSFAVLQSLAGQKRSMSGGLLFTWSLHPLPHGRDRIAPAACSGERPLPADEMSAWLRKLLLPFDVVHAHANSCCGTVDNTPSPRCGECACPFPLAPRAYLELIRSRSSFDLQGGFHYGWVMKPGMAEEGEEFMNWRESRLEGSKP
jgi:hypothetical protein